MRELRNTVKPLESQLGALKTQVQRSSWETAPLLARVEAVEAEVFKLTRESAETQGLRLEVEALKRRAAEQKPTAERRTRQFLPQELRENISTYGI